MKFSDFPLIFSEQDKALPWVRDHFGQSGGMLPQKIFKIKIFNFAENEFQTTKFPDFSLTFGTLSQIPDLLGKFPDFQRFLLNSLTFPCIKKVKMQWMINRLYTEAI